MSIITTSGIPYIGRIFINNNAPEQFLFYDLVSNPLISWTNNLAIDLGVAFSSGTTNLDLGTQGYYDAANLMWYNGAQRLFQNLSGNVIFSNIFEY